MSIESEAVELFERANKVPKDIDALNQLLTFGIYGTLQPILEHEARQSAAEGSHELPIGQL